MNIKAFMLDDQSQTVLYDPQDWFPPQLLQFRLTHQLYLLCHNHEQPKPETGLIANTRQIEFY